MGLGLSLPAAAQNMKPAENNDFYDNFLELGYDLSKVMFIATSNNISAVQPALRDRMEIIKMSGYTIEEKVVKLQESKTKLVGELLKSDESVMKSLSKDDLLGLLG